MSLGEFDFEEAEWMRCLGISFFVRILSRAALQTARRRVAEREARAPGSTPRRDSRKKGRTSGSQRTSDGSRA